MISMRKLFKFAFTSIILIFAASSLFSALAIVGVKKGDWIEFNATVTGDPPEGHDAQWGRMEVTNVQGNILNLNITTQFTNGTFLYENITLNLETGKLGDDFIIPANLNVSQSFLDANYGNITINSVDQRKYAGALRSVISGKNSHTTFIWDQQTGILVEAYSEYKEINFTMTTIVEKTNMWQKQTSFSDLPIIYLTIASILIILASVSILVWRRKKA
jgi:hypothetical protein